MSFLELVRLVFSNLMRMKVRLVMTSAGVVIGTASVILLISLGIGLQQSTLQSIGDIGALTEIEVGVNSAGNPDAPRQPGADRVRKLDRGALLEIAGLEGVAAVVPMLRMDIPSQLEYNRKLGYAEIRGLAPADVAKLEFKLAAGGTRLSSGQAIVGGSVLGSFRDPNAPPPQSFKPITDSTPLMGKRIDMTLYKTDTDGRTTDRKVRFTVVGVLGGSNGASQRDYTMYVSDADVIEFNSWVSGKRQNPSREGYSIVIVRTNSPADTTRVQSRIIEMGFTASSLVDVIKSLNNTFRTIQTVLGAIGAIALLVSAFGIANTMVMAIYERSREIGLMKAVGATHSDIMFIFLGESMAIGLIGGVVGTLLALLAGRILTSVLGGGGGDGVFGPGPIPIVTPLWLIASGIALAVVVGLVAGAYPALRTTRLDPIVALRSE